ncbi:hypothetical protein CVT25_009952 [Psilocybe cyanescens]|uniref:Uncharacterized protein n=1 Tax=Psilocybe cyanescens TaxID=93625 RepID=A0A409XCS0_PSICY|nr:hypothetical protein CVT25_009952 [Psilocybe cyanescens]
MSEPPSRSNAYSGQRQNSIRDKASYGIRPTFPSPTETSPGLAQSSSNSASNSSSSPPEPTTPPRVIGSRTRYPDLGRVPLHRRGTSKTYERLEDLLKEAGYKETRIFTPETERSDHRADGGDSTKSGDDNRTSVVKDGMEAVVGFFAGLLPSAAGSRINLTATEGENEFTTSPLEYSPPTSPLATRQSLRQAGRLSLDQTEPSTPSIMTSSIDSLGDPTPRLGRQNNTRSSKPTPTIIHPQTNAPPHQPSLIPRTSGQSSASIQRQPSWNSVNRPNYPFGGENTNIASPRPSRAGAYLRHMASTQSMPGRPNSTPVHPFNRSTLHLNESDCEDPGLTYSRRGNGEGEGHEEPPLPPTWLETVARAVLFGGTGAYIGGPSQHSVPDPAQKSSNNSKRVGKTQVLRQTRSSLSQVPSRRSKRPVVPRSGLSDQTNTAATTGNELLAPPPLLFSMIERGRSGRSEGEVSMTRVVCRSAPSSRSGSMVRGHGEGMKERWRLGQERGRDRKKRDESDRLPSLAKTQVEGDVWSQPRIGYGSRSTADNPNRYLSGWGGDIESEGDGIGPSSDEEDEGELDLARLLVPPKRQNSIKSLRKHLASQASAQTALKNFAAGPGFRAARGSNVVSSRTPSLLRRKPTEEDWDGEAPEEWGGSWARRGKGSRGSEDDDAESFVGLFDGRANTGSGRSRLGFASAWGGGS